MGNKPTSVSDTKATRTSSNSDGEEKSGGASSNPGSLSHAEDTATPPVVPRRVSSQAIVKWQWEDDSSNLKFQDYDPQTNSIIEKAYASGASTIDLTHSFFGRQGGYTIDFKKMTQTKTSTGFVRTIQRLSIDPVTKKEVVKVARPDSSSTSGVKLNEKGMIKLTDDDLARLIDPEAEGFKPPPETKLEIAKRLTDWKEVEPSKHDCAICLCELDENNVELSICKHQFHRDCVTHASDPKGFLKCPSCGFVYGIRIGNMPKGTMTVRKKSNDIAGYPGVGTIEIQYSFTSGTQGPEHPEPSRPYNGTSRTAYLPASKEGIEILELLEIAFVRRLTFRIGTSVTTGEQNAVIWNGIHHKTSMTGGSNNWGYPDTGYFDRVRDELKGLGVEKTGSTAEEVRKAIRPGTEKPPYEKVLSV